MLIGVDFDNTIVSYDSLFHQVAIEWNLIPHDVSNNKSSIRNYLRNAGREDAWTEMQGYVYGPRMAAAVPHTGVLDFFSLFSMRPGCKICIISHKTIHPYLGPKYNLHESALSWLAGNGFFDRGRTGLDESSVYLELTKQAKLDRIAALKCDFFIDDLPEFLLEPQFDREVRRILFDPCGSYEANPSFQRFSSWPAISDYVSTIWKRGNDR